VPDFTKIHKVRKPETAIASDFLDTHLLTLKFAEKTKTLAQQI
jgi:hypothetical protein